MLLRYSHCDIELRNVSFGAEPRESTIAAVSISILRHAFWPVIIQDHFLQVPHEMLLADVGQQWDYADDFFKFLVEILV